MSEFPRPEQLSRRERCRAARVSDIIHAINGVEKPVEPIEHTEQGFNAVGDYVTQTVIERPDAAQLNKTQAL